MSTTTMGPAALTAADRCDSCAAQARVRVVLPYGELLFCGHHFAKHAAALRTSAVRVDDFTDELAAPSA